MITSPPSFPPVAIKFSREAQLVTHYDSHLKYTSTVDEPNMIVDMAQRLGVGPRQLRMDFSRVLDLGSGDGRLTRHMAQFQGVEQVTGVDYSFARHLLSQREGNRTLQKKYGDKVCVYVSLCLVLFALHRGVARAHTVGIAGKRQFRHCSLRPLWSLSAAERYGDPRERRYDGCMRT
jgi:SAM-dependent methyltransferase